MAGGRPMNYTDEVVELWSDFVEYWNAVKSQPRIKIEYVGKDGERVETPLERPLTTEGFENFVFEKRGFSIHDYMYSSDKRYDKFSTIRSRVKNVVRQDQIEGGMVGQYNSSITQRLQGLTEKTDNTNRTEVKILNIDPLDDSSDNSTS